VRPHRVWFLRGFGLKNGVDFGNFGLKWSEVEYVFHTWLGIGYFVFRELTVFSA